VVADDPDAAAEVETEPEAEAQAEAEDEAEDTAKDEMVHPDLTDHQDTAAGHTATARMIALGAATKRKAMWMPQPLPTCLAATSTVALGSEIRGHQLASQHLNCGQQQRSPT
jgi:hypothetical protein